MFRKHMTGHGNEKMGLYPGGAYNRKVFSVKKQVGL